MGESSPCDSLATEVISIARRRDARREGEEREGEKAEERGKKRRREKEKDRGEGSGRREKKTPLATEAISVARREESRRREEFPEREKERENVRERRGRKESPPPLTQKVLSSPSPSPRERGGRRKSEKVIFMPFAESLSFTVREQKMDGVIE